VPITLGDLLMDNLQGRTCWRAFISGDDEAFEDIYRLYIDRLFSFGLKYNTDRDLVKDCLQDVFANIYYYRANLNPEANPLSYLFTALRNSIFAKIKKENKERGLPYEIDHLFMLEWSPETTWIKKEEDKLLIAKLQQLIKKLPIRQQEIIYLKFNEELGYEEIAEMLNISIPTCRTLVYRAIKQLRENIEHVPLAQVFCLFFNKSIPDC
jgi:RNA polymerase sigma factor (sigma-70 family)